MDTYEPSSPHPLAEADLPQADGSPDAPELLAELWAHRPQVLAALDLVGVMLAFFGAFWLRYAVDWPWLADYRRFAKEIYR